MVDAHSGNDENADVIEMDVEEVFHHIGDLGRFQIILDTIFCIIGVPMSYQIIIIYLLSLNPRWKCATGSIRCVMNGTFPSDDRRRCLMRRDDWEFTENREYSIVTQFDVYCEREWLLHLNSSILFAGWGIGAFFMGWVGNRYGRRVCLFPSCSIILVVGLLSTFSPNLFLIIISRFIVGFCVPGTKFCMFLLISELVGHRKRAFASLLIWATFPISISLMALQAYFIQGWKNLNVACTAPYIPLLVLCKFVPESFKWQLSKDKRDEAIETINRIAKWNKREFPPNVIVRKPPDTRSNGNPFDIFMQTPDIACKSILLSVAWCVLGLSYYGVYFAADDLGGSPYRDLFILSLSEQPAAFLAILFCDKFGRKPAVIAPLIAGSIACFIIALLPLDAEDRMEKIVIGVVGKLFLATSFSAVTTWTVEIYPVDIRPAGLGFGQIAGRIGSGSAPWIAKCFKAISKRAPFVVMGIATMTGAFLSYWLPETRIKEDDESNVHFDADEQHSALDKQIDKSSDTEDKKNDSDDVLER